MNRREAIQVLAGTAAALLVTPAKATSINNVQTPLKLPSEERVPEGLHMRVKLGVKPGDLTDPPEGRKVTGVLGSWWEEVSPNCLVPASPFIDKAQEAVNALLSWLPGLPAKPVCLDPARNVEIRFTFAEPFQDYNEMWEVKPEDLVQRRGFMVNRALTCEVNRVLREKMPGITSVMATEKSRAELEEYATRRRDLRVEIQEALRSVEILVWLAP